MGRVSVRGVFGLALLTGGIMVGCATNVSLEDDAGLDDASRSDSPSGTDSSSNKDSSGKDSSSADSSMDDSSVDDGSADADDGSTADADDGSTTDGGICPPCKPKYTCCTVSKSVNYGKCTSIICLACCM